MGNVAPMSLHAAMEARPAAELLCALPACPHLPICLWAGHLAGV